MDTLFSVIKDAGNEADKLERTSPDFHMLPRSAYSVLSSITSELGELAEEVNIAMAHSYKEPGVDGVIGEAVDVLCATIDLIHVTNPELTEQDIIQIARAKCAKWISKIV